MAVEFVLNRRTVTLDADEVVARLAAAIPAPLHTHWVEVDGRRWPPKQALRLALGTDEPFISHFALRVFRRLGFATSPLPSESGRAEVPAPAGISDVDEAAAAFARLDAFMSANPLRAFLAALEHALLDSDRAAAERVALGSGLDLDLIESALVIRERVGQLDSLIHAAVISLALPVILEAGETVSNRPSLGAGNDVRRPYDLETDRRVAEFKVAVWQGQDSMRQRGLVADLVGLTLDDSGRRRELYVLGERPIRYLESSGANALARLGKSALRVRDAPVLEPGMTVSDLYRASGVRLIDLRTVLPGLR